MEAHFARVALFAAMTVSLGASYRTPNFIVEASSQQFAKQIGDAAETYRRELAKLWVGRELRNWASPCPIRVRDGARIGAGGMTSFVFDKGHVFGWQMSIQGSRERILDSVLPHEVTHTIFASYFRQPLPRWADEGACTTMEHISERAKQNKMLIHFLKSRHGIPFSQMLVMKEYPREVLPLYSQGHSLTRFLIEQGNRSKFLQFIKDGMQNDQWTAAVSEHYGYSSLTELQNVWLEWVKQGSPPLKPSETDPASQVIALAINRTSTHPRTKSEPIYRAQSEDSPVIPAGSVLPPNVPGQHEIDLSSVDMKNEPPAVAAVTSIQGSFQGWQSAETRRRENQGAHTSLPNGTSPPAVLRDAALDSSQTGELVRADAKASAPTRTQLTRPQPVEKSRQIIRQWSRSSTMPLAPGESRDATANRLVPIRR
jgi:hypothetical protein